MLFVLKSNWQRHFILFFSLFCFGVVQAQVPDAPTNLVVTPINTGGMIQFAAPSSIGGSAISNYEYSTDGGTNWVTPSPVITESPIIISSGLTNCTSYSIKIRAVNTSGSGTASVAASLTPTASVNQGINWLSRTSAENNAWYSVTYGNGLFVAVANNGIGNRVMTSPDGITWTSRTSAADNSWKSVTYGNGLFVAVAQSGTGNRVMTSPDGITWTSRTSAADNSWNSVTYGNGLFVAVAYSGTGNRVMTSPNGITWTSRTSAADNDWRSITYGNGLFVAVASTGTGNRVMTSPDGITWTARTPAKDNQWYCVTYGNGIFVAVAGTGTGNRVMTSPDGINWTTRTSAADNNWYSVTYGNGLFVATSSTGTGNRVMTSPDGITWTSRTSAANNNWNGVTYGNGYFVAVASTGSGNRVMTSTFSSAADASVISAITPRNNAANVAFTQTVPVLAPPVSHYEYSTDDGSIWTARCSISPMIITGLTNGTAYNIKLRAINTVGTSCISNMISVTPAVGTVANAPTNLVITPINTGGMIQFSAPANDGGYDITNYEYSTDGGINWITPSPAITASPIIINSGFTNCTKYSIKIRAVNASGSGAASVAASLTPTASVNQGINWTSRTPAADNSWYGVTYGNGLFVAVANSGTGNRVMTSQDGITWTIRTSATDNNWYGVTYGNGLFVAVSYSGTGNRVMTSPDGITWTAKTSAADNDWRSITYGNGLFVAVASTGTGNRVMTSPDGITWTARTPATDNQWYCVTYGNGLFVAVAYSGTGNRVMTSPDGINWTSRTSAADNNWTSVTYGNGIFVAVAGTGTGNRVMTSPDGINWTTRTSAVDNIWNSVIYGNGLFVAVANNGTGNRVMTSPDGINWTSRTSTADNSWLSVTYGNGIFVAVSLDGTGNGVMTSSFSVAADAPVITSATFGSSTTVNFTQSSAVLAPSITNYEYSTDNGINWTAVSPAANTSPLSISGLATIPSSILIRAVNSVGSSCASNKYQCTPTSSTETASACGSYLWHGTTYTSSNNTATWTGTNAGGCDSVVTLNLTINSLPAAPSGTNGARCSTGTVSISAAPGSGETIYWYEASSGGSVLTNGSGVTSFTTPSISSTTTFYAEARNTTTGCVSATRTAVTATVNALPAAPTGTNGARCSTGTVSISATPGTDEVIDWYDASSGGSVLTNGSGVTSFTTPSISTTTIYYAEARNTTTGCVSATRTAVTATLDAQVTTAAAGADQALCNTSTFTLNGNSPTSGTGAWSFVGSSGTASISSSSSRTSTVTSVPSSTDITLRWTITNGTCSSTDDVVIRNNPSATTPTATNGSRCSTGTVSISATPGSGETIYWFTSSFSPSPEASGLSFTTPSISTTTIYYAEARNNTTGCISASRTAVTATVDAQPSSNVDIILSATGTCSNFNGTRYYIVGLSNGYYDFRSGNYKIQYNGTKWLWYEYNINFPSFISNDITSNGLYPPTTGWVPTYCSGTFTWNYASAVTSYAGADQALCNTSTFTLNGNTPSSGTGAWSFVGSSGGASITNSSLRTSTVTSVPANTDITLRWTTTNGACSSSDDVVIRNDAQPVAAAGADQSLCNTSTITMAAVPTVGTGAWTFVSGSASITSSSSATTTITTVPTNTNITLRWTETNGTCSSTDDVVIRNDASVTSANAGADQSQCASGSFTLAGNNPTSGTGVWTIVSGTATITDASAYNSGVTGVPANSTAVLRWTITNGTCSSTDEVSLRNDAQVTTANAGADQSQCASGSFTLAGNNPSSGTGAWTVVSGTATITSASTYNSGVTGVPANGTSVLRWTITNGTCSSYDEVSLRNDASVTASNAGADQALCNTSTFTLNGNTPSSGTGAWSFVGSSGSASITSSSSRTSTVTSVPSSTDITLRWTITNGTCSSTDDVVIRNNPLPDATISASGATTFTYGNSVVLSGPQVVPVSEGNALSLNGTSNYVSIPSGINSNFSANQITVEGWFYPTQSFPATVLIGEAFEGDGVIKFALYSNYVGGAQKIIAGFYSSATNWVQPQSSSDLPFNQWTHIAATYDRANIKIYVNGVLTCTQANTNALPNGSERWVLGKCWDCSNFFPGKMDEVRIWNVARTQSQIQNSMNSTINPTTSGLVGYYKLDESSGTTATDATGHGYDGTVN
jgi:hypothetical protein